MSTLSKWVPYQLTEAQLPPFRGNWFTSFVQLHQELAQLYCHCRWEVGSVCKHLGHAVVVPSLQTPKMTVKPGIHPKDVMLPMWLAIKNMLLFELLPLYISMTVQFYFPQLDLLVVQAQHKCPSYGTIYFLTTTPEPTLQTSFSRTCLGGPGKCSLQSSVQPRPCAFGMSSFPFLEQGAAIQNLPQRIWYDSMPGGNILLEAQNLFSWCYSNYCWKWKEVIGSVGNHFDWRMLFYLTKIWIPCSILEKSESFRIKQKPTLSCT